MPRLFAVTRRPLCIRFLTVISCTLAFAAALVAPSAAAIWQQMDGPYGGRVVALAGDAAGRVYAARNDEIFRSDDDGASWIPVSRGQVANILCLDVTPAGDLWAGVSSRGVWWSHDGGFSWDHDQITHDPHGGLGATIPAIGVDGTGAVLAGGFRSLTAGATWLEMSVSGQAFAFDSMDHAWAGTLDGVQFSSDHGATWVPRNAGMEGQFVEALAIDSSDRLFAGTYSGGLFRSTDAGASWTAVTGGLPSANVDAVAVDASGHVWLALADGSVWRSSDHGTTWSARESGIEERGVLTFLDVGGDVYAGTRGHGVFAWSEPGSAWSSRAEASMFLPALEDIAAAPSGGLFLATDAGVYRSADGGSSWEERSAGLTSLYVRAVTSDASGRVYAGTGAGTYLSTDEGASWSAADAGFEGLSVAGLMTDASGVIAILSSMPGSFTFAVIRSDDGGATWTELLNDGEATVATTAEGWTVDPDGRLFVGGMSLFLESAIFRSEDGGATWTETDIPASGLTGITSDSGGRLYATMNDNVLYTSVDHGTTWSALPNGGWPTGTFGALQIVAVDAEDAVLVSSGGGIWRSADAGVTWSSYREGLPAGALAIRFVRPARGALFAGTYASGLFRRGGFASSVADPVAGTLPAAVAIAVSPNPFTDAAAIRFDLPMAAPVRLTVHDVTGRLVRVLDGAPAREAGRHQASWDGRDAAGRTAPAGIYFVRVEGAGVGAAEKVILAR